MRAAVNLIPETSIARIVELAVLAEQIGFERCWVYDEGLATRDVYVTLTAIALATDTLELGPGITNPYTRHAGSTAGAIATLDELAGRRAFLGIGAGGSLTLDPLGIERARPLTAVRETMDACRDLFDGASVDRDGSHVQLRNATVPGARPGIEIWLAGRGPKMLALGGEMGDGVMLDFIHKPDIGEVVERIRAAGVRAGRKPQISYSTMVITNEAAMAATKPHMTYRLVDSPRSVKETIGLSKADSDRIRSAMRDGLDAAAAHVREEWVLPFVIAGTVDECSSELASIVGRHRIDEFCVPVLDDDGAEDLLNVVGTVTQVA